LEGALADFRRCSEFPDTKLRDYSAIHIWLVRAQENETVDANAELSTYFSTRANNASPDWEKQIAEFLLNQISEGDLLGAASGSDAERRRSEFLYYKAMKLLLAGDKAKAVECFREALTTEARPYAVMISGEILLGQLNQ
jgi:lipoprotein NlpI